MRTRLKRIIHNSRQHKNISIPLQTVSQFNGMCSFCYNKQCDLCIKNHGGKCSCDHRNLSVIKYGGHLKAEHDFNKNIGTLRMYCPMYHQINCPTRHIDHFVVRILKPEMDKIIANNYEIPFVLRDTIINRAV